MSHPSCEALAFPKMSQSQSAIAICPQCGRAIPPGAALEACPYCLLAAGLATEPAGPSVAPAPPAPAELAPEFPQLEILELIGRGGMGAVYKARQRALDRLVALKLLRPGLDADASFAERFTREARSLAQLNHPGIITLYEFGRTRSGLYFILMEFVDGVNLRQLLAASRLAPREALAIVPPLCDALQYAHDHGMVHRDIKPENILVDRLGRVKVADFGLAKLVAPEPAGASPDGSPMSPPSTAATLDLTEAGKVMGTPRYMAPEQRSHPNAVDHRADIYALGVVLYQMLTGELPDANQLQPPSQRVQLDVRLDEVVLRALATEPSRRYAQASTMKTAVEGIASSSAATNTRSHAPARHPGISQRLWWSVAAIATLGVVIFAFLLTKGPPTPPAHTVVESPSTETSNPSPAQPPREVAEVSPAPSPQSEPEREILQLKLGQARRVLELAKARFDAGLTNSSDVQDAKDEVAILEASLRGDPAAVDKVKLAAAERRFEVARMRHQAGVAGDSELNDAEDELAIRRAMLLRDQATVARVKLAAAERRLQIANQRYSAGVATRLDVDTAQTEVAVLKLQLEVITGGPHPVSPVTTAPEGTPKAAAVPSAPTVSAAPRDQP